MKRKEKRQEMRTKKKSSGKYKDFPLSIRTQGKMKVKKRKEWGWE